MSVQRSVKESSISISGIRKSISSFGEGLSKARQSTNSLRESVLERNRLRRRLIRSDQALFHKRQQSIRRKNAEDIVEASSPNGGNFGSGIGPVIAASTKGFLGRIMDAVGIIAFGWLVNNLPRIIEGVKQLINRIVKLVNILRNAITRVVRFFQGITGILVNLASNLINLDFLDSQGRLRESVNKLKSAFGNIDGEITNAAIMANSWDPETGAVIEDPTQQGVEQEQVQVQEQQQEEPQEDNFLRDTVVSTGIGAGIGGLLGGAIGALGFGAGAVPGAIAGAKIGASIGSWIPTIGSIFGWGGNNNQEQQQTVEPQQGMVNMNLFGDNQTNQTNTQAAQEWVNTVTPEDMDAVNQEREMFGQEPLTNNTNTTTEQPQQRSWWNRALGAVDYVTGGRTDFDQLGNTPEQDANITPSPTTTNVVETITPDTSPNIIFYDVPFDQSSGGGGSSGERASVRVLRLNSSRHLVKQITLNSLQYT